MASAKKVRSSVETVKLTFAQQIDFSSWLHAVLLPWSEDLTYRLKMTSRPPPGELSTDEATAKLLQLVNVRCRVESDEPYRLGDTVISTLKPVAEFLVRLAHNPFYLDLGKESALKLSSEHDKRLIGDRSAMFYIREVRFSSTEHLVTTLFSFAERYPYRAPEVLRILIMLGLDAEGIQLLLTTLASVCGVEANINDILARSIKRVIDRRPAMLQRERCSLLYAGCTLSTTPHGRAVQDLDTHGRFCPEFIAFAGNMARVHVWAFRKPLRYPSTSALTFRTDALAGDIERFIISAIGYGLNTEAGGFRERFDPESSALVAELDLSLRSTAGAPSAQLVREVEKHFKASRAVMNKYVEQAYRESGKESVLISDEAFSHTIQAAIRLQTINGAVVGVLLGDDTPKEAFTGKIGGPFDATAGRAFNTLRRFLSQIYSVEEGGDMGEEDVIATIGAFTDMFSLCLPTRSRYPTSVHILGQYLRIIKPTLIVTLGGLNAATFMLDESLALPMDNPPEMRLPKGAEYTEVLLRPVIVRFGTGACETSIGLSLRHPGQIKYRSIVSTALKRVQFIGTVMSCLLRSIVASRLVESQPSTTDPVARNRWLAKYVTLYEQKVVQTGLKAQYESADQALRALEKPYMALQQLHVDRSAKRAPFPRRVRCPVISSEKAERQEQMEKLLDFEKDRAQRHMTPDPYELGIGGRPLDSQLWKDWFANLKPGKNVRFCAQLRGRTREQYEKRTASLEKCGTQMRSQMTTDGDDECRPSRGDKARDAGRAAIRAKAGGDAEQRVNRAAMDVALKLAERSAMVNPTKVRQAVVHARCPDCRAHLLIKNSVNNQHHDCPPSGKRRVTLDDFPSLDTLTFAHELVKFDLIEAEALSAHPDLIRRDAAELLNASSIMLPRQPPTGQYSIWTQINETSSDYLICAALDACAPYLSSAPPSPAYSLPNRGVISSFDSVLEHLRRQPAPTSQLCLPRCKINCDYVGLLCDGLYLKHYHVGPEYTHKRSQGVSRHCFAHAESRSYTSALS